MSVHHHAIRSRSAVLSAAAAVALLALTACSSSEPSAESASPIGGTTTCDVAALTEPTRSVVEESGEEKLDQVDAVECGDGWAAVFADISSADSSQADTGITITLVFEAEGQFWIPKDRTKVCGTPSSSDPGTRPDDSQVPASIWQAACNTN